MPPPSTWILSCRHPKGLDASGGGSWSRQKHERATQTAIVLEDLKTVRLRQLMFSCPSAIAWDGDWQLCWPLGMAQDGYTKPAGCSRHSPRHRAG